MSTYWITGLSGAGKTTLAREIKKQLQPYQQKTILLDGDELREILGSAGIDKKNHDKEARIKLAMTYSRLCKYLEDQGLDVIIATISMFTEVQAWNRKNISGYFEIFINTDRDELRRRDPKGIYKQFDAGTLKNVAGEDLPVDVPMQPDFVVKSKNLAEVSITAKQIIQKVRAKFNESEN